jgi:Fe-S-cluster containining protein
LTAISALSDALEDENGQFRIFLAGFESDSLDQIVFELEKKLTTKIDCTQCGNCCKSLMITVSEPEATNLAEVLDLKRDQFDEQYLEKGMHGLMLINAIPCHFLAENKCSVYEHKFEGCREFPALHLPHFQKRLFTHFMHYHRCPIIFNVMEQLKSRLSFEKQDHD